MFRNQHRILLAISVCLVILLLVACGGGAPAATPTSPGPPAETPAAPPPVATPTLPGPPAETPAVPPPASPAEDLQGRISDSLNRTLGITDAGLVLGSLHIEMSGSEPTWDATASRVVIKNWTLSADMEGDDIYLVYTSDGQTTEGWMIDQGTDNEKYYERVEGEVQESFMLPLVWLAAMTPTFPLVVAATGPTSQGGESIDGRAAEKYGVDSANAPPGVMGILGGIINITASRGTAWVDQETGALLKATLDYEQKFIDPEDPDTVLGTGSGHVEILVTQVGQVTVQLP